MKQPKNISERVSYLNHEDKTTIIISPRIDRWKEGLLLIWLICFTAAGAYVFYELGFGENEDNVKFTLVVFLAFWAFFEFRIGKAFLWRKYGMEFISMNEDSFSLKKSIGKYGKAKLNYWDNMSGFKSPSISNKNVVGNLESSFWFVGGERIMYSAKKKNFKFGMQLTQKECQDILTLIKKQKKSLIDKHERSMKSIETL